MNTIRQFKFWYYKPKAFEYYHKKTIYDLIGIKIYKKYLPTTGDLARRWRKLQQIKRRDKDEFQELLQYELKTRKYEWRHWIGAITLVVLTLFLDRKLTLFDWIFLPLLNLYVNIYPIFLQRYNRIRILKILKNNKQPNPYDRTLFRSADIGNF
jgi:hypothetical protein